MNQPKTQPLQPLQHRTATQHKQLQLSSTKNNLPVPTPPNTTESQDHLFREESSPESLAHSCDLPENQAGTSSIRASSPILRSSLPVTARQSTESEYSDDSDVDFVEDPENDIRNTPENAPWKYVGYPLFSRWLARDSALLIVRRFGTLNSRIALSMQDDIVVLEKELDSIERILSDKKYDWRINNGSFRNDPLGPQGRRHKIIKEELPKKLAEYNAFINGYTQLISRPDIHKDDLSAVQKWFRVNNGAIDDEEAQYILANCDLIGVQPKPRSCLRQVLEMTVLKIPIFRSCFTRRPCPIYLEGNEKGFKGKTILQDDRKVEKASSFIVAVVGIGMLLGPLWILAYVKSTTNRLGVITAFVAIFFILVKVATKARIFDSLAATAAYSAVLMVFLQAPGI